MADCLTAWLPALPVLGHLLSGRPFTWSSRDEAVATVSREGLVLGVEDGTATIVATADGRSGTATITVVSADAS